MSKTHPSDNGPHELRDVNAFGIAIIGLGVMIAAALVIVSLWFVHRALVSDALNGGVSLPVQMPGEPTVNARIEAIPSPRLDALDTLRYPQPSARSGPPIEEVNSPDLHAEDLRADRQPLLNEYRWTDKGKGIARIPIERAMEALVDSGQLAAPAKKGGQP